MGKPLVEQFATIPEAIRYHAQCDLGSTLSIVDQESEPVSYSALWTRILCSAHNLRDAGVRAGHRVAVDMATSVDIVAVVVAIWAIGAVVVPLRGVTRLQPNSLDFRRGVQALQFSRSLWCVAPDETMTDYLNLVQLATGPGRQTPTVLPISRLGYDSGRCIADEPPSGTPTQPALIQLTSGSLSEPRGIVLTHRNITANVSGAADRTSINSDSRGVWWAPLSHDMGLIACLAICLYRGASIRMMSPWMFAHDPLRWIVELAKFRATHTAAPPFAYRWVAKLARLAADRLDGVDLADLLVSMVGAERVDPDVCQEFETVLSKHGLRRNVVLPAYGLAENTAGVALREPLAATSVRAFNRHDLIGGRLQLARTPADPTETIRLVGHGPPIAGTRVRIGTSHASADSSLVGEIQVGGESAARWLIDESGQRQLVDRDGFVSTGDMGALIDGQVYVVGRKREMFKRAGLIYAPTDIESIILAQELPDIADVAAIGVQVAETPDESLLIFLEFSSREVDVLHAAKLAAETRMAVLRECSLPIHAIYAVPFRALPRTPSGKIRRIHLAESYESGSLPYSLVDGVPPEVRSNETDTRTR
ncbi:MAG: AMP-binding protein [Mycobacterium sp.]|nr:AMP-binding protein [Mycobacterium sp.]